MNAAGMQPQTARIIVKETLEFKRLGHWQSRSKIDSP